MTLILDVLILETGSIIYLLSIRLPAFWQYSQLYQLCPLKNSNDYLGHNHSPMSTSLENNTPQYPLCYINKHTHGG